MSSLWRISLTIVSGCILLFVGYHAYAEITNEPARSNILDQCGAAIAASQNGDPVSWRGSFLTSGGLIHLPLEIVG